MKKAFKIIIPVFIVLVVIVTTIIIISVKRNNKEYYMNFEKDYSIIYEELPTMDVSIYSTNPDSSLFNIDKIVSCSLYNLVDRYNIRVNECVDSDNTYELNNRIYYECILNFNLDFSSDGFIPIDNCYMEIIFNTNEKLKVKIGNICFTKATYEDHIKIKKVQSIVNSLGEFTSLTAIAIQIESKEDVKITNIIPISNTISINNQYLLVNENITDIDNSTPCTEIFGENYSCFKSSYESFKQININNKELQLIIPLTYNNKEFVDSLGLIIEYSIDGSNYKQIVNSYKLFSTTDVLYFAYEYELSKI